MAERDPIRRAGRAARGGVGERPPEGLAERVLGAAEPELKRLRARTLRRRALATALTGTLLGCVLFALRTDAPRPGAGPMDAALAGVPVVPPWHAHTERIASHLQADGRFDPASWSGPAGDEVGAQALALLALARGGESEPEPPADALRRGAHWLIAQQDPGGALGGPGASASYEHALGTLALLAAYDATGDETLLAGTRAAVAHLARHERPGRSSWELQALERAQELDLGLDLAGPVARARSQAAGAARPDVASWQGAADFGELPAAAAAVLDAVATAH